MVGGGGVVCHASSPSMVLSGWLTLAVSAWFRFNARSSSKERIKTGPSCQGIKIKIAIATVASTTAIRQRQVLIIRHRSRSAVCRGVGGIVAAECRASAALDQTHEPLLNSRRPSRKVCIRVACRAAVRRRRVAGGRWYTDIRFAVRSHRPGPRVPSERPWPVLSGTGKENGK